MKLEIKDLLDAFSGKNEEVLEEIRKCEASLIDFSDLDEDAATSTSLAIAEKIFEVLPQKVSLKYIIASLSTATSVIIDTFLEEHHDGAEGREYLVFGKLMSSEIFSKLLRTAIVRLIEQSENE